MISPVRAVASHIDCIERSVEGRSGAVCTYRRRRPASDSGHPLRIANNPHISLAAPFRSVLPSKKQGARGARHDIAPHTRPLACARVCLCAPARACSTVVAPRCAPSVSVSCCVAKLARACVPARPPRRGVRAARREPWRPASARRVEPSPLDLPARRVVAWLCCPAAACVCAR